MTNEAIQSEAINAGDQDGWDPEVLEVTLRFEECGCCGYYHVQRQPVEDCRADHKAYDLTDLTDEETALLSPEELLIHTEYQLVSRHTLSRIHQQQGAIWAGRLVPPTWANKLGIADATITEAL